MLCPATLCTHKNQIALIRALDQVIKRLPLRLVLVGDAAPDNTYAQKVLQMTKERPWCTYGGVASVEEIIGWLERSSLMVLPSVEDNCPNVVLEAMAAGVPVAASSIGGIPDLIRPGETGALFDPRDVGGMAASIEKMLVDDTLSRAMAQKARDEARERFSPGTIAARLAEVYTELARS